MSNITMQKEMVRIMSCGTQLDDWQASNCHRCKKGPDYDRGQYNCEINKAMDEACMGNGEMTPEMAKRCGYDGSIRYGWQCPAVEWTEEWKKEYMEKRKAR